MSALYWPRAGSWYVSKSGKLMKVRMLLFDGMKLSRIMVEFLDGMRMSLDVDAWDYLGLDAVWHDERRSGVR